MLFEHTIQAIDKNQSSLVSAGIAKGAYTYEATHLLVRAVNSFYAGIGMKSSVISELRQMLKSHNRAKYMNNYYFIFSGLTHYYQLLLEYFSCVL